MRCCYLKILKTTTVDKLWTSPDDVVHHLICEIFVAIQFHMVEATYRVKEAKKQLYSENGRHPDDEEVAEAAGLSMKRLSAVMLTPKAPRSLDQKIGINQNLKPSVRPEILYSLFGGSFSQ